MSRTASCRTRSCSSARATRKSTRSSSPSTAFGNRPRAPSTGVRCGERMLRSSSRYSRPRSTTRSTEVVHAKLAKVEDSELRVFESRFSCSWAKFLSAAVRDLDVVSLRRAGVELARPTDLHRRIGNHFLPVRDPPDGPSERKHHGEHRLRNADRAVDDARVKIHVRIQLALDEILVLQCDLFELQRKLEQRIVRLAELREHLVTHAANDRRARVEVLIDAMAEAHQAEVVVLVFRLREILRYVLDRTDLLEHRKHRFVCTTVRRSPQCADAGRDSGIWIRACASRQAYRRGARVLFVIRVQDEKQVQCLCGDGID